MPYNPFTIDKPRAVNVPAGYLRSNPIRVPAGYSQIGKTPEIDLIKARLESQLKLNVKVPTAAPNVASPVTNISNNATNSLTQFLTNPNSRKIPAPTSTSIREASSIVRIAPLASRLSPLMRIADAVDLARNSLQPTVSGEDEAAAIKRAQDKLLQSGTEPGQVLETANVPPNSGGQSVGVKYKVVITIFTRNFGAGFDTRTLYVWGAWGGLFAQDITPPGYSYHIYRVVFRCQGGVSRSPRDPEDYGFLPEVTTFFLQEFADQNNYNDFRVETTEITRLDEQPDINPAPTTTNIRTSPTTTIASPQTYQREVGDRQPQPLQKQFQIPMLNFAEPVPKLILTPDLLPVDVAQPNPVIDPKTPSVTEPLPLPNPTAVDTAPRLGDVTTIYGPLSDPNTIKIVSPFGANLTSPLPAGQPLTNTGVDRTPQPAPLPTLAPTRTPAPEKTELQKTKEDLEKLITGGAAIAGLTPAIQAIGEKVAQTQRQTTPEALETAAAAGTCRTTQPGGCTSKALDDAVSKVNQNTNDKLKNVGSVADIPELALLEVINNKLGAQINGGIAGKLTRMSNWLKLPQVVNILTLLVTLHNAAMLSSALAQTLGSVVSTGLAAAGIKDDDGQPLNINEILGKSASDLMESMLGKTTWTGLNKTWQAANTVIRTTANIYSTVTSIAYSARNIGEFTASVVGQIGNALRKDGVVRENSYKQFPSQINAKTATQQKLDRMIDGLQGLDDAASALDSVASDALSIGESVNELKTQVQAFNKSVDDGAKTIKVKESTSVLVSTPPATSEKDEVAG